jgi:hypothetical protein
VLRRQEDLEAQAREMYELDHSKDQIMTLLKVGLANLGMWVRDQYFGENYQHCESSKMDLRSHAFAKLPVIGLS